MKKTIPIIILLIALIVFSSCAQSNSNVTHHTFDVQYAEGSKPETIDDILACSSNFVKAKLVSEGSAETSYAYEFDVIEDYTKNTPAKIQVYNTFVDTYKIGSVYYLLLDRFDSLIYPNPIFNTMHEGSVIKGSDAKFYLPKLETTIKVSDLVKMVKEKQENGEFGSKAYKRYILEGASLEQVLEEADLVMKIRISMESSINNNVSSYLVESSETIKGEKMDYTNQWIMLKPHVKEGVYYTFEKRLPDNSYGFFSREHTAVESSNEALLALLDKQNL